MGLDLSKPFDLVIIGGGINGAAVARDAVMRGLSVFICDKNKFGSGTSSKSSKLAHGGLRYLEQFQFGLVKESLRERDLLLKLSPQYVKPLPFLFPIYKGSKRSRWKVKCGMMLYDFLAQKSPLPSHQSLSSIDVSRQCPALKLADLKGGFVYYDAQMEDEQLVLANIQAGTDLGLTALQECECLGFIQSTDQVTGINISYQDKTYSVYGRCILNASGPWVDRVASLSKLNPISPYLSPTKGVHIVIPSLGLIQALILESPLDGRIFFIIPWEGKTLIGTTDTPFDGNPDDVIIDQDDVDYLIQSANFYLQHHSISKSDIVDTFAGLRPLQYSTKYSSNRSRDFSLVRSKDHLFHLFGGKYTSYRYIAEVVVNDLVKECDLSCSVSCKTHLTPL